MNRSTAPLKADVRLWRGRVVFVSRYVPDAVLWDYPLPIDLDDAKQRFEVLDACRRYHIGLGQVRRLMKEAA